MAEPSLRALFEARRRAGNETALTLAAPARLLALFEGLYPGVRRQAIGAAGESWRDYAGHDFALFLNGSARSVLCALWAGVGERIGLSRGWRAPLLTQVLDPAREVGGTPEGLGCRGRYPRPLPRPFGTVCVELMGRLGVAVADRRPRLPPGPEARAARQRRLGDLGLDPSEPYLLAAVGGRPGSAKALPTEVWGQALEALARSVDLPILAAAGPGEEAPVRELMRAGGRARILPLLDPIADLSELAALSEGARLFLGCDGGARHLARASGTPAVVIYGPTDPRHTAENTAEERGLRVELACSPCHRERCPLSGEGEQACMRSIVPEQIVRCAEELLGPQN